MMGNELEIKQTFTQHNELPQIVKDKKQEAYDMIYAQASAKEIAKSDKKSGTYAQFSRWHLPKVAGIILACFLVTGGTAVAAAAILSRWERLENMDKNTIEQYYEEIQSSGNLAFETNRPFTRQEQSRYQELEKAYKSDTLLPYSEIARLKEGESYSGEGVCLMITETGEENILYLPEAELSDEELLEIIEYLAKQDYALYETHKSEVYAKENWESRLIAMTDEDVDYYYLAFWTGKTETSDGLCRGIHSETDEVLTTTEKNRYQELEKKYEEENLVPSGAAVVIEKPEDYSGMGVALCRYNGNFYLPDSALTDEELLQIIDFRKKGYYSLSRIQDEIRLGYRTDYPKLADHNGSTIPVEVKDFADTNEKGSLKTREEAQIGDIIKFGSYEQDNDAGNGKEEIEWYVLDATQESMTLLSVKILDEASFASEQKSTTWKDSHVREWLNTNFYANAFSSKEQLDILTSYVENEDGADTEDKVYLLSYGELLSYFGIPQDAFAEIHSAEDYELQNIENLETLDSRIFTEATDAARANGLWYWTEEMTAEMLKFHNVDYSRANGNSTWWLRTTEENDPSANVVYAKGSIHSLQYVDGTQGIRPVIRIQRTASEKIEN